MATYNFQFCADSGRITYICASSRAEKELARVKKERGGEK